MIPSRFRLLIHHHAVSYTDPNGTVFLPAFIGRWALALARHFESIGLLLHESSQRSVLQDIQIDAGNISVLGLGAPGRYWDRIQHQLRIQTVSRLAAREVDGLLIRGYTTQQYSVWKHCNVRKKAFLLVGRLNAQQLDPGSMKNVLSNLIARYRMLELSRMVASNLLLMANSYESVNALRKKYDKQVFFVPTNTIRQSEFAQKSVRKIFQPWKLLYCGRIDSNKGINDLIQAVARLNQQNYPCTLNIVGDRAEPESSRLTDLAEKCGVSERIHWHGRVEFGKRLFEFYQAADLLVLPSYTEGFPHVLWEAAANCCPVVTTAVGGIPSIWQHERHALFIPIRDPDAIADAVKRLAFEHDLRARLVSCAYELALDYSVEECAGKLARTLAERW